MEKITGKTSTGFEYSFDKRIVTDWGFMTLLQKVMTISEEKNADKLKIMQDLILMTLGEEQSERLIDHVRTYNDGFAPIDVVMKELGEIIESKN